MSQHTSKQYDHELQQARQLFMAMGENVNQHLAQAVHAFMESNPALALQVIEDDQNINQQERLLDEQLFLLVAKRQPTANDLRFIMALSKGVVDLERIGDECSKIAKRIVQLLQDEQRASSREVQALSNQVRLMIHDALNAFAHADVELAFEVIRNDQFINQEYQYALKHILAQITDHTMPVAYAIDLLWIFKALERIGDHAKNIAELVIYSQSGTDVRHVTHDDVQKAVDEVKQKN
ncbi:MAG: phosphate signaling complex protein PhoU [Acinetobacter sp.]|nr:phosphate signaling complex protein PhoU [Acinetobacter sp.]